jgi:hypothetical protein
VATAPKDLEFLDGHVVHGLVDVVLHALALEHAADLGEQRHRPVRDGRFIHGHGQLLQGEAIVAGRIERPTRLPALVPATTSTVMPCASSALITPMWAKPRAAPPPRARPILILRGATGSGGPWRVGHHGRRSPAVDVSKRRLDRLGRSAAGHPGRTGQKNKRKDGRGQPERRGSMTQEKHDEARHCTASALPVRRVARAVV